MTAMTTNNSINVKAARKEHNRESLLARDGIRFAMPSIIIANRVNCNAKISNQRPGSRHPIPRIP